MTDAANQRPAVSVVLPVYNGASFINDTLREVLAHLATRPWSAELIVVDDGSTDDTAARCTTAAAASAVPVRVLRVAANEGKGAAIARGVRAASGKAIIFLDADRAYPPENLDALQAALAHGADLAVANRVHPDSRYQIQPAVFGYLYRRYLAGRLFNALVRLVLLPGLRDTQAGLKGFSAGAAARLFHDPLPRGFSFDLGLLTRARELGLRIEEIPVSYRSESEPTTVRFLLDTGAVLRDIFLLRLGFRVTPAPPTRRRLWQVLQPRAAAAALVGAALAGLLLLGVARLRWPHEYLALAGWALLLAATGLLALRADPLPRRRRRSWPWSEWFALLAVLAVGTALRFVDLSAYPPMVHLDSAECGLRGLAILHGKVPDVFDFSPWYDTPYLSFVPYAASYAAVGSTILALRLPSALLGTLTLPPLYVFARVWFGRGVAWIATALLAVSHVAIHFSRIGLWNVQTLFYEMVAFACLAYGVRRERVAALFAAGVVSGLALYSYTAGRLILIVSVAFLATLLCAGRARRVWRLVAFYLLGLGAAIVPLVLNYVKDPSVLSVDRVASVWVLAEENREHVEATVGTLSPLPVLADQTLRTLEGFGFLGDTSSQYGTSQPLVTVWIALLALAGLFLALRRWRVPRYRFLILWTVLGLLLGSILILNPPSHTRLLIILPLPFVLAAMALVAIGHRLRRAFAVGRPPAAAAAVALVAVIAAINLRGYQTFNEFMYEMPREWDVLRAMERLGDTYDYYLFTGPFLLADSPIFQLFAAKTRAITGFTREDLPDQLTGDTAFIVLDAPHSLGAAISAKFPGSEREVIEQEGQRQMVVYRCAAADGCDAAFN